MYRWKRVNNYPNDPQMQYYSYDVYFETENGFTLICECTGEKNAKLITALLNKNLNSR